jgi:dsRNA-specific ribonuclease
VRGFGRGSSRRMAEQLAAADALALLQAAESAP